MIKEYQFIRTVRLSGGSLSINIPKEIVQLLKLKRGNVINVKIKKEE